MYQLLRNSLLLGVCLFMLPSCVKENQSRENNRMICLPVLTDKTLDILTWNLHDFPGKGDASVDNVSGLIRDLDADLIALQEITNTAGFQELLSRLPDYQGIINTSGDLNLAFLWKKNQFPEVGTFRSLFEDDPYIFPRPPLLITVRDALQHEFTLINVHLKCCEGSENEYRRKTALHKIKAYLDDSLGSEPLVILGDFNREVNPSDGTDIFYEFSSDSIHYRFADGDIIRNDPVDGSFPSWPSHLDHIIVSDEIFKNTLPAICIKPDLCDSTYFTIISDHRPVLLQLDYQ